MKAANSKTPNAYSADCPTRQILDRVGDKWAVLILLLVRDEPMRFNALRRTIEGISQKMLSQVLKSLERDGLVRRRDARRRGRSVAGVGGGEPEGGVERAAPLRRGAQGYRGVSYTRCLVR